MARASREVYVDWNLAEVYRYLHEPNGPLGVELLTKLAEVVLAGAKRRALRRTGRMIDEMHFELGTDEPGIYADIISPVQNLKTGFPYALMHEKRKPRDRRPHRSLVPALRDIRKILTK